MSNAIEAKFQQVEEHCQVAWVHQSRQVWIRFYDQIDGVRQGFYQAYRAVKSVPAHRSPWSIDNRRVGSERGFATLDAAMLAADGVAA